MSAIACSPRLIAWRIQTFVLVRFDIQRDFHVHGSTCMNALFPCTAKCMTAGIAAKVLGDTFARDFRRTVTPHLLA